MSSANHLPGALKCGTATHCVGGYSVKPVAPLVLKSELHLIQRPMCQFSVKKLNETDFFPEFEIKRYF